MPHHDASTFTINIALNHVGIDYEVSADAASFGHIDRRESCLVQDSKRDSLPWGNWRQMTEPELTPLASRVCHSSTMPIARGDPPVKVVTKEQLAGE